MWTWEHRLRDHEVTVTAACFSFKRWGGPQPRLRSALTAAGLQEPGPCTARPRGLGLLGSGRRLVTTGTSYALCTD